VSANRVGRGASGVGRVRATTLSSSARKARPVILARVARGDLLLLAAAFLLTGCSWFTDFRQQPKIDPWESPADSIPFRANPQGSVPITGTIAPGFAFERVPMGLPAASPYNALVNPVPADSASVSRGRIQFQINCAVCHGPLGAGNGVVLKYGMAGPPIGAGAPSAGYSDGYIFGMIRNGRGLMPSYNRIEEHDRWDVVNYLRALQGKGTIAADSTHGRPGETGPLVPGATVTAPTRPAPYFHRPLTPGAATDTTKKPESKP